MSQNESTTRTPQPLPEDCHLAYVVTHEAWYGRTPGVADEPSVTVCAASNGGGVAWEFTVKEHELGSTRPIAVRLFDEAFDAFLQIPQFFTELALLDVTTLDGVRTVLDAMGANDETERETPERYRHIGEPSLRERITDTIGSVVIQKGRPGDKLSPDGLLWSSDCERLADAVLAVLAREGA